MESVKHEITPSLFRSRMDKMFLTTTDDKKKLKKNQGLEKTVFWSYFKSVQISSSFQLLMRRNFRDTAELDAAAGQATGTETRL